ncbi:MAG: hypothetical protein MK212_10215 [Saprospiraceae bacterium]|nr:hypothetical protein [Saprospiraceae bacterium]
MGSRLEICPLLINWDLLTAQFPSEEWINHEYFEALFQVNSLQDIDNEEACCDIFSYTMENRRAHDEANKVYNIIREDLSAEAQIKLDRLFSRIFWNSAVPVQPIFQRAFFDHVIPPEEIYYQHKIWEEAYWYLMYLLQDSWDEERLSKVHPETWYRTVEDFEYYVEEWVKLIAKTAERPNFGIVTMRYW